jgi:[acyl-carrier-protein] S-malonyltransferase
VVGGHTRAIEFLEQNHKDFNLRKVKRLPVSGAFHTDLMADAAEAVRHMLGQVTLNMPKMPTFSNVSGRRYHTAKELRKLLPKQIVKPVMWEQTVQAIYQR